MPVRTFESLLPIFWQCRKYSVQPPILWVFMNSNYYGNPCHLLLKRFEQRMRYYVALIYQVFQLKIVAVKFFGLRACEDVSKLKMHLSHMSCATEWNCLDSPQHLIQFPLKLAGKWNTMFIQWFSSAVLPMYDLCVNKILAVYYTTYFGSMQYPVFWCCVPIQF